MGKQAADAGFEAVYLGGGATGYEKLVLEANLTLTEMVQTGLGIGAPVRDPIPHDPRRRGRMG